MKDLATKVLNSQQLNGGFGYYKDQSPMLEATAYAIMALNAYDKNIKQINRGIEWILSIQNNNGSWALFDGDESNSPFATSLALITLHNVVPEKYKEIKEKGINYLLNVKDFFHNADLDENIWGWNTGGYISSEPTAYSVIALKMYNKSSNRIKQAEKFFKENQCEDGGWTYFNPVDTNHPESKELYINQLTPQLHITALVLLALQDNEVLCRTPFELIDKEYTDSYSPLELSLCALAYNRYNKDNHHLINRLNKIMKNNYEKEMPFNYSLTLLANLTTTGINPLWIKK